MPAPLPPSFEQLIRDNVQSRRIMSVILLMCAVLVPIGLRGVALSIAFDAFLVLGALFLEVTAQRVRSLARLLAADPQSISRLWDTSVGVPKSARRDGILHVELTTRAHYRLRATTDPVKSVLADLEAWRVVNSTSR